MKKIEQWLVENMAWFLTCTMIAFIGADQLLLNIPMKNLYECVFIVATLAYLVVIGAVREINHCMTPSNTDDQ